MIPAAADAALGLRGVRFEVQPHRHVWSFTVYEGEPESGSFVVLSGCGYASEAEARRVMERELRQRYPEDFR